MKILNILITAALIIAALYGLYLLKDKLAPQKQTTNEIPAVAVVKGDFTVSVTEMGLAAAKKSITVNSPIEGKVIKICREGSIVKKGDFLAQIDQTLLEKDVREKQLSYEQAQADLKQVEEELTILNVSSELEIKTKISKMQYDKTELEVAKENLERQKRLYKEQIVTLREVESAESSVRAKKEAVKKDEIDVEIARRSSSSDTVKKKAQVNLQKLKLEKAKMDYELAKKDLGQTTITSPADGLVTFLEFWKGTDDGKLMEGDDLNKNTQIMAIPNLNSMVVDVLVKESDVNKIKPGQKVIMEIESSPGKTFPGEVKTVNPVASNTRWVTTGTPGQNSFAVQINVEKNTENIMRPGMNVTSKIIISEQKSVLSLPNICIFEKEKEKYVWLKTAGGFEQRDVIIGEKNEESTVIKSGLNEGDTVALRDPTKTIEESEVETGKTGEGEKSGESSPDPPAASGK